MLENLKSEWKKWGVLTPSSSLYDRTLIWLFLSLLVIGIVMVTSASIPVSTRLFGEPFYFSRRSGYFAIAAISFFVVTIFIPSKFWEEYNIPLFLISLIMLLLTLAIGNNVNGATRWITLGPVNFQSAELAKLAAICYFSGFYVRKLAEMKTRTLSGGRPLMVLGLIGGILYFQSDLGSFVVLFAIIFLMLFIVGAKLIQFGLLLGVGGLVISLFIISSEYRMKRMENFIDPFADAYGHGFQLSNSQMAFGQGEWFGRGLGNSVQKLEYLPEAHTDFVMAVVAEEFGLFGIVGVVLLLIALTVRVLKISRESLILNEKFKGFFAFGIGIWIFLQGFVNLGVASGLLPTKGLTFPLVSYGGSSLVIMAIAIAILVRIDYENRIAQLGHAHLSSD